MLHTEIERPSQLPLAPAAPRFDMYGAIHKALRSMMGDTLVALGATDAADDAAVESSLAKLEQLIAACASHLEHENRFVHPAIEARSPGTTARIAEDHVGHETALDELRAGARAVRRAGAAYRGVVLGRLYRGLALFVAENFEHMEREETGHNQALWDTYSDAELLAIHDELVGSIPPAEMMQVLQWMIPSVSHAERAGMLGGMRAQAPEGVFEAVLDLAYRSLSQREWAKLARTLGVPPVPGLVRC